MTDTSPETTDLVHARLMARTGAERFMMGIRMHEAARRMVMASFPAGTSALESRTLLRARFYGDVEKAAHPLIPPLRAGDGSA